MLDDKKYNELKKHLKELSTKINDLILNEDEPVEKNSFLNSGASKQTWSEFFLLWSLSPATATYSELSTWHGARDKIMMDTPTARYVEAFGQKGYKIPVSSSWKTWKIKSGTKASNIIDNVKNDEKGEYIEYRAGNQIAKLYLPNETWFNKFNDCLYKFQTDNGSVYTLDLSLKSNKTSLGGVLGGSDDGDPWVISLTNKNPEEGNGWTFELGSNQYPYFRKEGNILKQVRNEEFIEDIKSSFELFWDEWGTTIQIVLAVALAVVAPEVEAALLAAVTRAWGARSAVLTFLTAEGVFTATRGRVLVEFLLESLVNLPAAYIDSIYDNEVGAALGIAFCFFPLMIRTGKFGRFISGNFNEASAKKLGLKVMDGVYSNMTPDAFVKFLGTLTEEEKLYFAQGMSWLMKKENSSSLQTFIKEAWQTAIKNKNFPSKFMAWLKTTGLSTGKVLGTAFLYFGITLGGYVLVKKLQEKNNDNRTEDELKKDAQEGLEYTMEKFKNIDENEKLFNTTSFEIIDNLVNSGEPQKGAEIYYNLSIFDRTSKVQYEVANKLLENAKENLSDLEKLKSIVNDPKDFKNSYEDIKTLNSLTGDKMSEKEINSLFVNNESLENIDPINIEELLSDSNNKMNSEYNELVTKYPCVKDNFLAVEGDYSFDPSSPDSNIWWIKLKPKKETLLWTPVGKVKIQDGQYLYLYNNGKWYIYPSENHVFYKEFKCSE
jgi:hypothetical protein